MRDYLRRHAEKNRLRVRAYRAKNVDEVREKDRARGFRGDPVKVQARNAARVLDPEPCEGCGAGEAVRHHDDYSKPLEVRWLCRTCHGIEHRRYP